MEYATLILAAAAAALGLVILLRMGAQARQTEELRREVRELENDLNAGLSAAKTEISAQTTGTLKLASEAENRRLEDFARRLEGLDARFEAIRGTVETRLSAMQQQNEKKLDEMRQTVDEKLQKTLESRIGESFRVVSERLEQVWKGLGEMQNLAVGVGDLKKVLSNVKNRGILGEIQLGAILRDLLSPEQYEENVVTKPGTRNPVEFAVRLPGDGDQPVLLPIDSKFPADAYQELLDAYDAGSAAEIEAAGKALDARLRIFAKDIREKYIDPPNTTEFGIMFLPFEGLYAEVVRRGLVEELQREYRVNIAGPTTMAALLNSLQMGFRTLAIQKRSGEISKVLGAVKTEFATFEKVLTDAQNQIGRVNTSLDSLIGVRTRQINRRLKTVTELDPTVARAVLEEGDATENAGGSDE